MKPEFGILSRTDYQQNVHQQESTYLLRRAHDQILEEAKLSESLGFKSFHISEHHLTATGFWSSPLLVLCTISQVTSCLKLGTLALLLPLYHPVHVAEDSAFISTISGGRFILGLAPGYSVPDFSAFGVDRRERFDRFSEGVQIIRQCWRGKRFSFKGNYFKLDRVMVTPTAIGALRPQIWIGAWSENGVRRAGEIGDSWAASVFLTHDEVIRLSDIYKTHCERIGKRHEIAVIRETWIERDEMIARKHFKRFIAKNHYQPPTSSPTTRKLTSYEALLNTTFCVGSPESCINRIQRLIDIGVSHFVLRFRQVDGPSMHQTKKAMSLFAEEVINSF
jgi:alkanesulfonate monooxygenase SsuD/methylene tetrahydromethanopterin reductase-like flavin-dependent oxidoreductase (luciferase family)